MAEKCSNEGFDIKLLRSKQGSLEKSKNEKYWDGTSNYKIFQWHWWRMAFRACLSGPDNTPL